jgi:hypothetical protein
MAKSEMEKKINIVLNGRSLADILEDHDLEESLVLEMLVEEGLVDINEYFYEDIEEDIEEDLNDSD